MKHLPLSCVLIAFVSATGTDLAAFSFPALPAPFKILSPDVKTTANLDVEPQAQVGYQNRAYKDLNKSFNDNNNTHRWSSHNQEQARNIINGNIENSVSGSYTNIIGVSVNSSSQSLGKGKSGFISPGVGGMGAAGYSKGGDIDMSDAKVTIDHSLHGGPVFVGSNTDNSTIHSNSYQGTGIALKQLDNENARIKANARVQMKKLEVNSANH